MINVKPLRKKSKMNRRVFAQYFDVPYSTVCKWESIDYKRCSKYIVLLIAYKLLHEGFITRDDLEELGLSEEVQ